MAQNKIDEALSYVRQKYDLQKRPATFSDFLTICKTENVGVYRDKFNFGCKGMFICGGGVHVIWIAPHLNHRLLRKVGFHILGYYFLHRNLKAKFVNNLTRTQLISISREASFFAKSLMFGGVQ